MKCRADARSAMALVIVSAVLALGLPARSGAASYGFSDSTAADSAKTAGTSGEAHGKAHRSQKDSGESHGKAKAKAKAKRTEANMETKPAAGTMPVKPDPIPQHVQVQHILIGFSGSVPGKSIARTQEQAKALAYQILDRARKGESFDELVRQYTDDSPPGIYGMSGIGVAPAPGEFPRDRMVPAFGNVGFAISPGNIGIADFDPSTSPYGWHVIKRLK